MCTLLTGLACMFGVIPLIWAPIVWVLSLGMTNIYLCGIRGKDISSTQLFEGFGNGKFLKNAGGIGWMNLWVLIWGMIPFVGLVMAIIKSYSYRFVPYIMLSEPDLPATEALKKSIQQTNGYKGKMWLADFVIGAGLVVLVLVFGVLSMIPFVGVLFVIIGGLALIVAYALLPLLMGIISAVCYEKITQENAQR